MKYKLFDGSLNDTDYPIETILYNRGIRDPQKYLNLSEKDIDDYNDLDNIKAAVDCFVEHFERGDAIGILVDTDPDGICSSTIMYKYILELNPNYPVHLIVHKNNKSHGLQAADFDIPNNTKLMIIPDSSSNDIDECQQLIDNGISIIIADHHTKSDERLNPAILLNNQTSPNYKNKDACGTHITWDFIRALDEYFWTDTADNYLDLVALANISDVMNIKSEGTRATINVGLNNIQNKMFDEIIQAQEFSMNGIVSPHTVAFYVTPLINAFLRLATYDERVTLLKAFCEIEDETFEYTKRGESFPIDENIYEHCVRIAKSYKGKQDRAKKKAVKALTEKYSDLSNNKVVIIDATDEIDKSLTGVVAIQISEVFNRPTLILKQFDDQLSGSGRAFDNCPIDDFRGLTERCPGVNWSQGHNSAFGASLDPNCIDEITNWFNEQLKDVDMGKVYNVDFEVDACDLDPYTFITLDKNKTIWGNGVGEPLFALTNLFISSNNTSICGKNNDTIQIYDENTGVKYVKFKCNESDPLYQWIINNWDDDTVCITVIGKLSINSYNGQRENQVTIVDVNIER